MKIAVYPNIAKPEAAHLLTRILAFFQDREVTPLLTEEAARAFGCEQLATADVAAASPDVAIAIGGDGTFLGVCRKLASVSVPVCGVNIGALGFMADIEPQELEKKLAKILQGDYQVEERLRLSGFVRRHDAADNALEPLAVAVNDVVVTKSGIARMLKLSLSINGLQVTDCKADGFIVSTPTGSTAYSLSAGGPILNPTVKSILLTPICAHTLNLRPLVIDEEDEVSIYLSNVPNDIIVTFDGQKSFDLRQGDELIVRRADSPVRLIKFSDRDYYEVLRTKLWHMTV